MSESSWAAMLRSAIAADGRSTYRLAQATGLDRRQLDRFILGERSLGLEATERLAAELGLELARSSTETARKESRKNPPSK